MRRRFALLPAVSMAAMVALLSGGCAWLTQASMAPLSDNGVNGTVGVYGAPAVSANGRYIAYAARSDTRVPGASYAVFVYDTVTGKVADASVSSTGVQADDFAGDPSISADGRYVAFDSYADNLDPNEQYLGENVYVRDMVAGTTSAVNIPFDGSVPDDDSYSPVISNDGNKVAFLSDADNLIANDQNISTDLFVRNRSAGTTARVDLTSTGGELDDGVIDGTMNGAGTYVAYSTDSAGVPSDDNMDYDVYRRALATGAVARATSTTGYDAAISTDGRWIAYDTIDSNASNDTNAAEDVYLRDMNNTTATNRVLVSAGAGNVAPATGTSSLPSVSDDGRFVAFQSTAQLASTDTNGATTDSYVRDTVTNRTYLVGTTMLLAQPPLGSGLPHITADGHYVVFVTAGDLTGKDSNLTADAYERATIVPEPLSVSPNTIKRGTTATLVVTGNNFFGPGAGVVAGVQATTATVNTEHKVTLQVTIPSTTATGAADLYIGNYGTGPGNGAGASGKCASCVTITP
jgi:hypothetical protein